MLGEGAWLSCGWWVGLLVCVVCVPFEVVFGFGCCSGLLGFGCLVCWGFGVFGFALFLTRSGLNLLIFLVGLLVGGNY